MYAVIFTHISMSGPYLCSYYVETPVHTAGKPVNRHEKCDGVVRLCDVGELDCTLLVSPRARSG